MRRRASNSSNSYRRHHERGFTLVELVTVVTIVGILAAIAAPSFRDFIIQQRIRNAAFELMADLTFARSEAVKRNATVTMSKTGSWTGGWTITDAGGNTLRQHPAFADTMNIAMTSASIDFTLNGRASPAASFTIDDSAGKATIPVRYVCVDQSGRARSTDASCT